MSAAYTKGFRAFLGGDAITSNPYAEMSQEWKDWNDGYLSAETTP